MRLSRISLIAATVVAGILTSGAVFAQAISVSASGTKKITLSDKVGKNQFVWNSDAVLEKIKGSAEGVTGAIMLDPKNLATLRGTISAQVSTMKTGNGTRDGHLKSSQWLDVGKFPTITFTIGSVSGGNATGTAHGTFTMHGTSKQIAIPFKLTYIDESEKTRARVTGDLVMITADFTVALKDFNVEGTKGTVGSKVGETIAVSAQLFGSTAQ